jgi:hypothetical protein
LKVTFDEWDVMVITPENSIEEYALRKWLNDSMIHIPGDINDEDIFYIGRMLDINGLNNVPLSEIKLYELIESKEKKE